MDHVLKKNKKKNLPFSIQLVKGTLVQSAIKLNSF